MSQAVVDPSELRRFAQNLDRFSNELESQMLTIRGQLNNLSQSWRDQEQEKFTAEFEQTLLATNRFLEAARQHVPFLMRKAERVEDYLRQR
jgi:WXG100 family type VII secretion target